MSDPIDKVMVGLLLTLLSGIALFIGGHLVEYTLFDLPTQRAQIACEAQRMTPRRPDFSRTVTCVPRYNGADSVHVTGMGH